jgi:hypothetical protein
VQQKKGQLENQILQIKKKLAGQKETSKILEGFCRFII